GHYRLFRRARFEPARTREEHRFQPPKRGEFQRLCPLLSLVRVLKELLPPIPEFASLMERRVYLPTAASISTSLPSAPTSKRQPTFCGTAACPANSNCANSPRNWPSHAPSTSASSTCSRHSQPPPLPWRCCELPCPRSASMTRMKKIIRTMPTCARLTTSLHKSP